MTIKLPNLTCLAADGIGRDIPSIFPHAMSLATDIVLIGVVLLAGGLLAAYLRERRHRRQARRDQADSSRGQAEMARGRIDDRRQNQLLDAINTLLRQEIYGRDETDLANATLAFAQEFTQSKFAMMIEMDDASPVPLAVRDGTGDWPGEVSVAEVLAAQPARFRRLWSHVVEEGGEGGYARVPQRDDAPPGAFTSVLVLPLRRQGELELVLLLAETTEGYTPADLEDLGLLVVTYLEALRRCRSERLIDRYRRQLDAKAVELKRSNEELEQFAYVASHDLQEPLRKITAFGDRLKTGLSDDIDERSLLYLDRMVDAAQRMRQLIDDLLQYSRAGRGPLEAECVDVEDLVRRLEEDVSVDGELQVDIGQVPPIKGNKTQLRILLQNLLSNARKFRKPDQDAHVQVWSEPVEDGWVRLCVRDEGIGLDEKFAKRVFRPFQRLHSRSEYPGTGIGLAICQKIARSHGGSISVHSQPGEGTRFEIVLPRWGEDHSTPSEQPTSPSSASDQPMT